MKLFIRLLLLAGVLAGLVAWLKELLSQAEPPGEAGSAPGSGARAQSDSPAQTGSSPSNGGGNGGAPTRDELYEEAQRLEIKGRSKMSKQELERAVQSARS